MTDMHSFLGLASYYRRFIQDFAEVASPLHKLAEKGNTFVWTEACDRTFCELKRCLLTAPALACPKFDLEFILDTNAISTGIGAVLSKVQDG